MGFIGTDRKINIELAKSYRESDIISHIRRHSKMLLRRYNVMYSKLNPNMIVANMSVYDLSNISIWYVEVYDLIMDCYMLARIFRTFDGAIQKISLYMRVMHTRGFIVSLLKTLLSTSVMFRCYRHQTQ